MDASNWLLPPGFPPASTGYKQREEGEESDDKEEGDDDKQVPRTEVSMSSAAAHSHSVEMPDMMDGSRERDPASSLVEGWRCNIDSGQAVSREADNSTRESPQEPDSACGCAVSRGRGSALPHSSTFESPEALGPGACPVTSDVAGSSGDQSTRHATNGTGTALAESGGVTTGVDGIGQTLSQQMSGKGSSSGTCAGRGHWHGAGMSLLVSRCVGAAEGSSGGEIPAESLDSGVALAVSGGVDSTAMALAFSRLVRERGGKHPHVPACPSGGCLAAGSAARTDCTERGGREEGEGEHSSCSPHGALQCSVHDRGRGMGGAVEEFTGRGGVQGSCVAIHGVVVDHRLRAESREEAELVAEGIRQMGE